MRVMSDAEIKGLILTNEEIAWCEAHPELPEARAVLKFARIKKEGNYRKEFESFALASLEAMRKIMPQPEPKPKLFDAMYAYVVYNPLSKVEGIPGIMIGKVPTMLIGADLDRIREMLPIAREAQRNMRDPLKLVHLRPDRVIPPEKILYLRSENVKTKTVQEIFAYIGKLPTGQETILGYRDNRGLVRLMAHGTVEEIIGMRGIAADIRAQGQSVELRRFVKVGYVEDPKFDLRTQPRPNTLTAEVMEL